MSKTKVVRKEFESLDLDELFRPDSAARKVAESLLTGGEISRQELSTQHKVAVTTVNRVVAALEEAGATIKRDTKGRHATFQVVSVGPPPVRNPYPMLGAKARLVRADVLGENVVVDFVVDDSRYRGTLATVVKGQVPVGLSGTITSVNLESDHTATVKIETETGEIHLGFCRAVTV